MKNSKENSIMILKSLEKVFPEDMTSEKYDYIGNFDKKIMKSLEENGLIEYKKYSINKPPIGEASVPKITSKGIEFLNGLKQKRTNRLLLILTILLSLIGIVQIFIMLIK